MDKSYKKRVVSVLLKCVLLFSILIVCNLKMKGDDLAITFNSSHFNNGYNVSCHGAHDGKIEAIIVGGVAPYTFYWNNGSFSKLLTNLVAGQYIFSVTDGSGRTIVASADLIEPDSLSIDLSLSNFGGYNISSQGGSDGNIETFIGGGSPPYTYLWSNGVTKESNGSLSVGSYSVTVTDANGCSVSSTTTLVEPTPLHIVSLTSPIHNGFNISCYAGQDGAINLNVAGGVPPYKYTWTGDGGFTQNLADLKAGDYSVRVEDDNHAEITATKTLSQPNVFKVELNRLAYSNGFNLTCHDCSNGRITAQPVNGVSPITFLWSNSQTTAVISGLEAKDYQVHLTDANGCMIAGEVNLYAPDRDDWSVTGNLNTDPTTQYLGTNDPRDFAFRTNNIERLKILSNGIIKASSLAGAGSDFVTVDSAGRFQRMIQGPNAYCYPWNTCGNIINATHFIGSTNAEQLNFRTANIQRMTLDLNGRLGIGTPTPTDQLEVVHHALIGQTGGIVLRNASGANMNSEIKFSNNSGPLWAIGNDVGHNGLHNFFIYDELATNHSERLYIDGDGRVGIGVIPPTSWAPNGPKYKLYVEDGIETRDVLVTAHVPFPDYVFDSKYTLMSIKDLKKYVEKNSHLPDVPSANDVESTNGFEIGALQMTMLKKLEEQTLYIIQLQEQITELNTKFEKGNTTRR